MGFFWGWPGQPCAQLLRPRTSVIIRVSAITADTSLVPWFGGLLSAYQIQVYWGSFDNFYNFGLPSHVSVTPPSSALHCWDFTWCGSPCPLWGSSHPVSPQGRCWSGGGGPVGLLCYPAWPSPYITEFHRLWETLGQKLLFCLLVNAIAGSLFRFPWPTSTWTLQPIPWEC